MMIKFLVITTTLSYKAYLWKLNMKLSQQCMKVCTKRCNQKFSEKMKRAMKVISTPRNDKSSFFYYFFILLFFYKIIYLFWRKLISTKYINFYDLWKSLAVKIFRLDRIIFITITNTKSVFKANRKWIQCGFSSFRWICKIAILNLRCHYQLWSIFLLILHFLIKIHVDTFIGTFTFLFFVMISYRMQIYFQSPNPFRAFVRQKN